VAANDLIGINSNASPARGFPPSMAGGASGAGAWSQSLAAPEFVSREPEPALLQPDNLARNERPLEAQAKRP
jgi:hypothetical protein